MKSRNVMIDMARVIGTLSIIVAHVGSPRFVNELRCYDVVLLVFISGFCISCRDYPSYLIKRFKRLVLPTWLLLVILFSATGLVCLVTGREQWYPVGKMLRSFLFLNNGIGYIWVVRVYLGVALVTPLLQWCEKKTAALPFGAVLASAAGIAVCSAAVRMSRIEWLDYLIEILGYSIVAFLGYHVKKSKEEGNPDRLLLLCGAAAGVATVILSLAFGFVPNESKYPPDALYLCYGITGSCLVVFLLSRINPDKVSERLLHWIRRFSVLSFDTYLVHVFVLTVLNFMEDRISVKPHWTVKYMAVVASSFGCAILIHQICDKFQAKKQEVVK